MHNHPDDPNAHLRHTINTYDQMAAAYVERRQRASSWKGLIPIMQHFIDCLPPKARVLDLGCGPGHDTELLNDYGFRAIGVDLSRGMLAQARQWVKGDFAQADMRFLPLPDGHFDAVWMCASLLHLPRTEAPRAIGEVNRVLRAQGIFDVSVKMGQGEALTTVLGERYFTYYALDEFRTLVENGGFTIQHQFLDVYRNERWINLIATKN